MDDKEAIQKLQDALEKKRRRFTDWEQEFVGSVKGRSFLTEKQREAAQRILSEKSATEGDRTEARQEVWDAAAACERCLDGLVVMRLPFTNAERSYAFDYKWPLEQQYREAVAPCTCGRGELRRRWQRYKQDAADLWNLGWRRVGADET